MKNIELHIEIITKRIKEATSKEVRIKLMLERQLLRTKLAKELNKSNGSS